MGHLYLVFSRSDTLLSRLIHLTKGSQYTHAALALDEDLQWMYSFGRKYTRNPLWGAFRREAFDEGVYAKHQKLPGVVLKLTVSEQQYEQVRAELYRFLRNQDWYGYNYKVLFRNLFGASLRDVAESRRFGGENRFVCSEFVYHVLEKSGIVNWQVRRESVMPEHLLQGLCGEVVYQGDLKQYASAIKKGGQSTFVQCS